MHRSLYTTVVKSLMAAMVALASSAYAGDGKVVLIHTGDIHGHLVARPNVRSDTTGRMEGGVARMYTVIQNIRKRASKNGINRSLLINTGDTLQGSGEALYTRGQAMIDVLNLFKIDAHAPGNWDFLYGPARFEEAFIGTQGNPPLAPWSAMASNLYYTQQFDPDAACGIADAQGNKFKRVLPAYKIKRVGKVKVGILGFTTARAIAVIGPAVTAGYRFTDGKVELPCYIDVLRNQEKVDLVVMISELEMARDIQLAEAYPGVDIILNSDMHEETTQPIVTSTGTILVEEGQDGTMVGEMRLKVKNGKVAEWEWKQHIITDRIRENKTVAARVAAVRTPFVGATFIPGQQVTVGGNTSTLMRPLDSVIAYTQVPLHRSNFVDEDLPGVVEGSSHDLIADAMRWAAKVDAAAIRGFRYGTHIPAGWPITMQDIYHYIPVAAKLGRSTQTCGADLKMQIENSTQGTFSPDARAWIGGWMFGYSNVSFDLDACAGYLNDGATDRGTNIRVGNVLIDTTDKYNPTTKTCASGISYSIAGYWFADDPNTINNCNPCRGRSIQVIADDLRIIDLVPGAPLPNNNTLLDVTEAVVKYLEAPAAQGGIAGLVTSHNLPLHRISVKRLPTINPYPFKVVQPLNGATAATCPLL